MTSNDDFGTGEVNPVGLSQPMGGLDLDDLRGQEQEQEEDRGFCPAICNGRLTTITKCLSCMLSVGILAIPSAFSKTGIITSIVLILGMAAISLVSMLILISLAGENKIGTFPDLVQTLLGPCWAIVFSIVDLISVICATTGYLITGADIFVSWFAFLGLKIDGILYRALLVGGYWVVILLLLAIRRSLIIHLDGYIPYITVLCASVYLCAMLYKAVIIYIEIGISPTVRINRCRLDIFSSLALFSLFFGFPSSIL
jgi:hypothetical protein